MGLVASSRPPTGPRRSSSRARRARRLGVGVAALAVVAASAVALPGVAGSTPDAPDRVGTRAADRVIVCESGVVEHDGVRISAASASRVGHDDPPEEGCREG